MSGELCWKHGHISRTWGFSNSDCTAAQQILVAVSMHCTVRHESDGSMHVRYQATSSPVLLPFITRKSAIDLEVQPDGKVVRFAQT